jgi:hypothetical protein
MVSPGTLMQAAASATMYRLPPANPPPHLALRAPPLPGAHRSLSPAPPHLRRGACLAAVECAPTSRPLRRAAGKLPGPLFIPDIHFPMH